jgi:hypothetical protein
MLIYPAIGDTDPIRYRCSTPGGQFSGHIFDEVMRAPGKSVGRQALVQAFGRLSSK